MVQTDEQVTDPGETRAEPPSERNRHRLRWTFLGVAASALVGCSFLLMQLKLGLPMSFAKNVVFAGLVGIGIPVLLVLLAGQRLARFELAGARLYVLSCCLLIVVMLGIAYF